MVLFKRHPDSSAKTTLKPPFFCHVTCYIKVRPKINAAAPETPRRPGHAPTHRKPAHLLGSEVNSLLFEIGGEMKNLIVPPNFSAPPLPFHAAIVCFHRCPQTGVIGARGRRLQITVITRNDLFRENSHACHFVLECGGSDASGTLGNGALQLISNTLMLIVCGSRCSPSHAGAKPGWVFLCVPFFFFFFLQSCYKEGSAAPPLIMIMHDAK